MWFGLAAFTKGQGYRAAILTFSAVALILYAVVFGDLCL
jgi:hypothetical protein